MALGMRPYHIETTVYLLEHTLFQGKDISVSLKESTIPQDDKLHFFTNRHCGEKHLYVIM